MFDQKETYTNYINSWVGYQMGNTFNLGAPCLWPYPVWLGIGGMDVEMKREESAMIPPLVREFNLLIIFHHQKYFQKN